MCQVKTHSYGGDNRYQSHFTDGKTEGPSDSILYPRLCVGQSQDLNQAVCSQRTCASLDLTPSSHEGPGSSFTCLLLESGESGAGGQACSVELWDLGRSTLPL